MAVAGSKRILIVEDNDDNRKILVYRLRRMRDQFAELVIDEAADGLAAVKSAAANRPNLIIMDINMPVMDGFEAARTIRGLDDAVSDVPIIALTAECLCLDDERCAQTGVSDYIQKPIVDPDQLQAKVLAWIGRGHRHADLAQDATESAPAAG